MDLGEAGSRGDVEQGLLYGAVLACWVHGGVGFPDDVGAIAVASQYDILWAVTAICQFFFFFFSFFFTPQGIVVAILWFPHIFVVSLWHIEAYYKEVFLIFEVLV